MESMEEVIKGLEERMKTLEAKLEIDPSIQESRLRSAENELEKMRRQMNDIRQENEDRLAQQEQRDAAQDTMIKIELSRISQEVSQRASREEIKSSTAKVLAQLEQRLLVSNAETEERLLEARSEVNDLVNNIKLLNDANTKANQLLEQRLVTVETKLKQFVTNSTDSTTELRFALQTVQSDAANLKQQMNDSCLQVAPRLSVLEARFAEIALEPASDGKTISISECIKNAKEELKTNIIKVEERVEEKSRRTSFSVHQTINTTLNTAIEEEREARLKETQELKALSAQHELLISQHDNIIKEMEAGTHQTQQEISAQLGATRDSISSENEEKLKQFVQLLNEFQLSQSQERDQYLQRHYDAQAAADAYRSAHLKEDLAKLSERISSGLATLTLESKKKFETTSQRFKSIESNVSQALSVVHTAQEVAEKCANDQATFANRLNLNQSEFQARVESDLDLAKVDMAAARSTVELESAQMRNHLKEQCEEFGEYTSRLQRSILNQTLLLRRVEKAFRAVCTRAGAGEALDAIVDDYLRSLATHCVELEANATTPQRIFSLPYDAQRYFAAAVQSVSERLAMRADFECLRKMLAHDDPTSEELWDESIAEFREAALSKFTSGVRDATAKLHPATETSVHSARDLFLARLELGLRVGISKHQRIQPNYTLFGKLRLKPTCVACDRPFAPPGAEQQKSPKSQMSKTPSKPYSGHSDDTSFATSTDHYQNDFSRNKPSNYMKRGGGFRSQRPRPFIYNHIVDDLSSPLSSTSPTHQQSSPAMLPVSAPEHFIPMAKADANDSVEEVKSSEDPFPRPRQLSLPQL